MLVPLWDENYPAAPREVVEIGEHPAVAGRLITVGRDAASTEIARPEPELVPAKNAPVDGYGGTAEASRKREAGGKKAEDDGGAGANFGRGRRWRCQGGPIMRVERGRLVPAPVAAPYFTPPGGRSHGESRLQRSIWQPF